MLVLSRKLDERVLIGDDVIVTIVEIRGNRVKLGVSAPQAVPVNRQEVAEREQGDDKANPRKPRKGTNGGPS